METLDIKNKLDDEIYISIEKFCVLNNISKMTFYRRKSKKQFPYKMVKLKGYGKKLFILIKKDSIVFINKNNILMI